MERKHIECWKSGKDCKHCKALMEGHLQGRATKLLNMSRQQLSVVIGLLTGHFGLSGHLYKIGKDINPLCRRCSVAMKLLSTCYVNVNPKQCHGVAFWTKFWRASTTLTCPSGPISTVCSRNRTSWEVIGGEAQ